MDDPARVGVGQALRRLAADLRHAAEVRRPAAGEGGRRDRRPARKHARGRPGRRRARDPLILTGCRRGEGRGRGRDDRPGLIGRVGRQSAGHEQPGDLADRGLPRAGRRGGRRLAGGPHLAVPAVVARPRQLVDDLVEPPALDELHGIVGGLAVLAYLEDRHDVRVVQPRRRLRLPAEPLQRLGIMRDLVGQYLQRHPAAQADLLGLVDDPHAAPADLAHDPILAELAQGRGDDSGRRRLAPGILLGLLDLDQGREHLADLVGHLRQAVDVLLQARPLAPAIPLGELLGQLVEAAIVAGAG